MTKLFILLVFSVSTFSFGKSPLETFDLPEEERNATIDYCAPTGSEERILPGGKKQRRYLHPSGFAGLSETDEPPYDLIESREPLGDDSESNKARIFLSFMADGVGPEYGCDRLSVLYFAKFIKRYWPGSDIREKYPNSAELVDDFLNSGYDIPLIRHSRIEARNMLVSERK